MNPSNPTSGINRRQLSTALLASLASTASLAKAPANPKLAQRLAEIDAASGGRLGVCVIDSGTGARTGHRDNERFPMCSSFKLMASAAVLARVDRGQEKLDRRIVFQGADLMSYSPGTARHAGAGMTLGELCAAAITLSDNTAANLILADIGGPGGFTRYARSLGDTQTRLDRIEPMLNEARPGDPRDTTTPAAMAADLERLLLGQALSPASRAQLDAWMAASQTGGTRLRAGVPADWRVGDKTGTGRNGTANVIGILRPPQAPPILVAAYLTGTPASAEAQNASLAAVAAAIVATR
jgi:beta-lactamase class A